MAKEAKTTDQSGENPEGVNVDAKAMLLENGAKGTVIRYTDRVKVRLLKDTKYQKAGKVYSPAKVKGDFLVKLGIAEYVKD
jgi:hypothetical protein